jgi:hypothetical protein
MSTTPNANNPEELAKHFATVQENWLNMKGFARDKMLITDIPEIATNLIWNEFQFKITNPKQLPFVFVEAWEKILTFVASQNTPEFAVDICGVSMEYTTEYSENEKNTNIVPQLIHKRIPMFRMREHSDMIGSSFKNALLQKYNSWRTENLTETLTEIENDVFAKLVQDYGIDMIVAPTIFIVVAAMYAAGVQIAIEQKCEVNMYNIFTIEVFNGDQIVLTPGSTIKQSIKGDAKKF